MKILNERGVLLLGCGKMGSALLKGWLAAGIKPSAVSVIEPKPSDWLRAQPVVLNSGLRSKRPAVCVLAVKPQILADAVQQIAAIGGGDSVVLSIAAGVRIAELEKIFGLGTPVVRSMPNTPAAIGHGISAFVGNEAATSEGLLLAEKLLSAVGETVSLDNEEQLDAVTAVSGSGPAYVFNFIEGLAAAGEAEGLSAELAMKLAKATVAGAGKLALAAKNSPSQLRIDVTSPNGTTEAALKILMNKDSGLARILQGSVRAAAERSRELGR